MSGQRKSASDRKSEIVNTAIRLAGLHGPDRVTTQHLAEAIGISQPAIFRHFSKKGDIWLAVAEAITKQIALQDLSGQSSDPVASDPVEHLCAIVTTHLGQIAKNPAIPAILFSRELHAENEPLRRHFETLMTSRRAGFSRLIARAQAAGAMDANVAADTIAALILAALQGLAMRWSLENRGFDLETEGGRLICTLIDSFKQP